MVNRLEPEYEGEVEFVVYEDSSATREINDLANEQGVQFVPTMMIVDADGTELERMVGGISEDQLRPRLDSALNP